VDAPQVDALASTAHSPMEVWVGSRRVDWHDGQAAAWREFARG